MRNKPVLVKYFEGIIRMAQYAIASLSSDEQQAWSMPAYLIKENQSKAVADSSHKVDCKIHFRHSQQPTFGNIHVLVEAKSESSSTIFDANFGQIADYGHSLWECQPTRLFVAVLFIYSAEQSLVVFTRDK
ncbi:hypothetical protein IW148_003350 [Coemansia sp. RSA 1199]|nr:hypothetical protein IW148_003350 [Coemansia sp. RSA 1199]